MIQSQFDAAAKLGVPKNELSGAASDERPRKRRKTTPPIEDSIEVAPETFEAPAPTNASDMIKVASLGGESPKISEANATTTNPRNDGDLSTKVEPEMGDGNDEVTDQAEDEVILLSEESVLGYKDSLYNQDHGRDADQCAKEEVPDPPSIPEDSTKNGAPPETVQAAPAVEHMEKPSSFTNSPSQYSPSIRKPPGIHKMLQHTPASQITSHPSGLSTPKPAANSGPQTTFSSPLSSPPPAELFDSFLTEPPASSTRPSSPVSTEDERDEKSEDEDDSEPSFSQDFLNRSSTFKRSLSTLKGKELFDASIWSDPLKTSVFYTFATNLRQKSRDAVPTGCHQFIGHLSKAGKMVRCYTQNIDLLEDKVGLSTRLLLGAGSRSRFSTRVSKGVTTSTGGSGTRTPSTNNNQQPTTVPPVSCTETPVPSQPALGGQSSGQEAMPPNGQEASSQPVEDVNIDKSQTQHGDKAPADGGGGQNGEPGGGQDSNNENSDAQPLAAALTDPEKPVPKAERGKSPEHDRGVECVFLHGSLRALRCFQCGCITDWDDGRELQTMSGQQPPCPRCEDATNARQERGKRALGVGKLRPDIVLYGEDHPESQRISTIIQHDISLAPDMLIIMGTSLKVHGLKTVVREFAKTVHNRKDGKVIFVNYTKPAESVWSDIIDFWVEMDCDSWVEDLKEKKPIIWLPPGSVEAEPRNPNSKRRRTLNDDVVKKEAKKSKKAEKPTTTANDADGQDKDKAKVKEVAKPESPTDAKSPADAKPYVPKRPAAHRDCKQNAAYWTTKILSDLASMTGRVLMPGPPPYRPKEPLQNAIVPSTSEVTPSSVTSKIRRGPRTKNTRSKILEAAAISEGPSKPTVKKPKAPAKRRPKSTGATVPTEADPSQSQNSASFKDDANNQLDDNVLTEMPVPNDGPHLIGQDIPMVAAVKNRVRKPKIFFGDVDPSVPSTRRATPMTGNAKAKSKAGSQAKKIKAIKSESTPGPDEMQSTTVDIQDAHMRILPRPNPIPQPPATMAQQCSEPDGSFILAPLRPSDLQITNTRRNPFLQMALGQSEPPDSASPPPDFLEPIVSPGPLDKSPQMSPNHWRKRAFSYGNALSRHFETSCRNLDFANLRGGVAGEPPYMEYPRQVPSRAAQLVDAPPLLIGVPIVPILSPPVEPLSAPDSPNRQLHRESEAAAVLTQMAAYDHRQFDRM